MNPYGTLRLYGEALEPLDAAETAWMDLALCAEVGDDFWFPEKGGTTVPAKRICQACDVRAECLRYALKNEIRFGIWGGMSEQERRRLKRLPAASQPVPQSRKAA